MMLEYFRSLESGIEQGLSCGPEGALKARKLFALEVARIGIRLYSGERKIAWCGVLVPFDLLNAMDLVPCFVEFVGSMLANLGSAAPFLEVSEQSGYSTDICSYHRAINGAAMKGLMPVPDLLVASSSPCSGGLSTIERLAGRFEKPLFVIDIPYKHSAASVKRLADQYRRMVRFAEENAGVRLDPQALRRAVANSNLVRDLLVEIFDLCSKRPSPARRNDMINFLLVMSLIFGTDDSVGLAASYRDELLKKVQDGTPGIKREEVRLLWFQNRIQFKSPLEKMLEEEFNAAIVADELNSVTWGPIDPDSPYEGMAERTLTNPLASSVDLRIGHLLEMAEKYQIDGVLNPCHWGCRQGTGARGLIEKALRKNGIPVLNLEVDCIDSRNFSEGQLRTRVGAFMETIRVKKGV
jgi:benzoyl-CoA reductase/2-hydroxyglutaryl-CoA dehydratase subunit BcrC/BadD/HgdB